MSPLPATSPPLAGPSGRTGRTGRPYLRVSVDRFGQHRSTSQQLEEILADAANEQVILGDPYRDDDRSASRYATRPRGDFNRLMTELRSGDFDADILWLWESSRGSRQVGEWVALIDECDRHGILIRVTTHNRYYDPRNPRDRRSLLEDAVDSEYESSKGSLRSKRAAAANAAAGKPSGRVPYGYQRRYDERTRELLCQERHPVEGPIVEELFRRVLAGDSFRSIRRDFERRGVRTRSGKPFLEQSLRKMLYNFTYAGIRVHEPGINGRREKLGESARITPGTWEALVSETDFYQVRQKLTSRTRSTPRPGRARHLLSLIARCAHCDSELVACKNPGSGGYRCRNNGCVGVHAADLDGIARDAIADYLARQDVYAGLQQEGDTTDTAVAAARKEVALIRAELAALADAVGAGQLTMTFAAQTEPQLVKRLHTAEQELENLFTPAALRGIVAPGVDIREHWDDIPLSARRELARLLLSPELIGTLVVYRTPGGSHTGARRFPVKDRIGFRQKSPTPHPDEE